MSNESKEVDIILAEYKSLREEIIKKMEACWKILTFETGGTSIILGLVFSNGQYVLLPIVPFLILCSSFIHLSEASALINAGNYIRGHIEKDLKKFMNTRSKSMSWETYVRSQKDPYRLVHVSTVSLFMGMFLASIVLTVLLKEKMEIPPANDWLFYLLLLGYFVAFVVYLYTWLTRIIKKL